MKIIKERSTRGVMAWAKYRHKGGKLIFVRNEGSGTLLSVEWYGGRIIIISSFRFSEFVQAFKHNQISPSVVKFKILAYEMESDFWFIKLTRKKK